MTNADRIRAMDDVELAEFLYGSCQHIKTCKVLQNAKDGWIETDKIQDACIPCWLDWLRQEVEDGS